MKETFRKIFSSIISRFEAGEGEYSYRKSHRVALIILGCLFTILSTAISVFGIVTAQIAAVIPGVIFIAVGVTALIVGFLGNDRAVSKIWGNK